MQEVICMFDLSKRLIFGGNKSVLALSPFLFVLVDRHEIFTIYNWVFTIVCGMAFIFVSGFKQGWYEV